MTERVLKALVKSSGCIQCGEFDLASGVHSQLKIDYDHVRPGSITSKLFARVLASKLRSYSPDLLVSVPTGPDWHIPYVSRYMGWIPFVLLEKPKHRENLPIVSSQAQDQIDQASSIALIEDVLSSGYSTLKTAQAVGIGKVTVAGAFIDRGVDVDEVFSVIDVAEHAYNNPGQPVAHIYAPYRRETALRMPVPVTSMIDL